MAINNPGTAPVCTQWQLTITASAARITVANPTDTEPPLVLTGVVSGHSIVVDGAARTVLDNGTPHPTLVAPGSGWPGLVPGPNAFTVVGGTGTFRFTPLYL